MARFRGHHPIDPYLIVLTLPGGERSALEEAGEPEPFVEALGSGRGKSIDIRHRVL
jgi:hypothetical protein